MKDQRNDFEDLCLARLKALLPEGVTATILADRGFGDVKLFEFLGALGFQYVIRFRSNTHVRAADGETREAGDWVGKGGRARKLRDAEISAARQKVGAVVCVKASGMKDAWHLAASDGALSAAQIVKLYSKRWTIEPSFRDSKDLRFGMGMGTLRIDDPQRRDRLLLLNAFAIMLLTLLGAAGESLGMDRQLRTSTAKRRVHSLFRQGCLLYELIPNMPDERLPAPHRAISATPTRKSRVFRCFWDHLKNEGNAGAQSEKGPRQICQLWAHATDDRPWRGPGATSYRLCVADGRGKK